MIGVLAFLNGHEFFGGVFAFLGLVCLSSSVRELVAAWPRRSRQRPALNPLAYQQLADPVEGHLARIQNAESAIVIFRERLVALRRSVNETELECAKEADKRGRRNRRDSIVREIRETQMLLERAEAELEELKQLGESTP